MNITVWRRLVAVTSAVLVLCPKDGRAQATLATLTRGVRVRVLAPIAGVIWPAEAVFDSSSADSIFVHQVSDPPALRRVPRMAIPLTGIERFEVPYEGRSRWDNARTGALVALGISVAFAAVYVIHERATCTGSECFGEGYAWIGLAGSIPVATVAGGSLGLAYPVKRWQRLPNFPIPR